MSCRICDRTSNVSKLRTFVHAFRRGLWLFFFVPDPGDRCRRGW